MAKRKKKGKKRGALCLTCGLRMKRKQVVCDRGHVRPAAAAKARTAAITKGYSGNVVPLGKAGARRTCWNGHPRGKRGATFCVQCGEPYGISYGDHFGIEAAKAARALTAPKTAAQYMELIKRESNPEVREFLWKSAHPEVYGNGGAAS
jgi:hypothetical protein